MDKNTKILADFHERRALFDEYIKQLQLTRCCTCPSCGYPTIDSRGHYNMCVICHWEDDNQDDPRADEEWGGPNTLSLTESRLKIGKKLQESAKHLGGTINQSPREVLEIIWDNDARLWDNVDKLIKIKNS